MKWFKILLAGTALLLLASTAFGHTNIPVRADCPGDTVIVGETNWLNTVTEDRRIYNPITISNGDAEISGPLHVSSTPVEECEIIYGGLDNQ